MTPVPPPPSRRRRNRYRAGPGNTPCCRLHRGKARSTTCVPQHSSINGQDIGRNVTAEDFLNADVPMAARMAKLSPLNEESASCPATQTNLGSICGSQTSKPIAQRLPLVQDQNRYIPSLRSSTENGLSNLMILRSGASDHCRWSNLKAQSSTVGSGSSTRPFEPAARLLCSLTPARQLQTLT